MLKIAVIPLIVLLFEGTLASHDGDWQLGNSTWMPDDAWMTSLDAERLAVYIGRVNHGGAMYVATITPEYHWISGMLPPTITVHCHFASNGRIFTCENNYEIFVGATYYDVEWVNAAGGSVPSNAVHLGGRDYYYIGRLSDERPWNVGTVERDFGALSFADLHQGQWVESLSSSYQVLCWRF